MCPGQKNPGCKYNGPISHIYIHTRTVYHHLPLRDLTPYTVSTVYRTGTPDILWHLYCQTEASKWYYCTMYIWLGTNTKLFSINVKNCTFPYQSYLWLQRNESKPKIEVNFSATFNYRNIQNSFCGEWRVNCNALKKLFTIFMLCLHRIPFRNKLFVWDFYFPFSVNIDFPFIFSGLTLRPFL